MKKEAGWEQDGNSELSKLSVLEVPYEKNACSDLVLTRWKTSIYLKTKRFVLSYSEYVFLPTADLTYYGINIEMVFICLSCCGININTMVNTTQDQNLPQQVQIFFLNLPISYQQAKQGIFKITPEVECKN